MRTRRTKTVSLTHSATSTDTDYDGITIAGVTVTVTDNDTTLEVTVTPGDAQLVVEWTAVDTATVYTVQWKSDSGATRVYVDHRRWSSSQDTRWENGRRAARVQYAECDDRHGPPSFLRRRSMKHRWLEPWRGQFRFVHQRLRTRSRVPRRRRRPGRCLRSCPARTCATRRAR